MNGPLGYICNDDDDAGCVSKGDNLAKSFTRLTWHACKQ